MTHAILAMGQRFVRCSCTWVGTISAMEYAERPAAEAQNLLLDMHSTHVVAAQGRADAVKLPCDQANPFVFRNISREAAYSPAGTPGHWFLRSADEPPYIICPECGHAGRLGNHYIAEDGGISPSIICPRSECGDGVPRCSAHYYGRLDGWNGGRREPVPR